MWEIITMSKIFLLQRIGLFFIALFLSVCPAKEIENSESVTLGDLLASKEVKTKEDQQIKDEKKLLDEKINQMSMTRSYAINEFLYKNENKTCPDSWSFEYKGSKYSLQFPSRPWTGRSDKTLLNPIMLKDGVEVLSEMAKDQLRNHYMKLMMDADFKIDLQSEDKRYLYFPCRASFVLDLETNKILQFFRPVGESVGSLFYDDYNLAIYTNSITVTDLNLGFSSTIVFHDESKLLWAELAENNQIIYSTTDKPNEIKRINHRVFSSKNTAAQEEYVAESYMMSLFSGLENLSDERSESRTINGVKYDVNLYGPDEPNNGRMVTAGEFLIDGTKLYGKGASDNLKFEIATVKFFSPDEKYIFIPYENGPVIYSIGEQSYFSYQGYGTQIFNYFADNYILSRCEHTLNITNTITKITEQISIYDRRECKINLDLKLVHRESREEGARLYTVMEPLILN